MRQFGCLHFDMCSPTSKSLIGGVQTVPARELEAETRPLDTRYSPGIRSLSLRSLLFAEQMRLSSTRSRTGARSKTLFVCFPVLSSVDFRRYEADKGARSVSESGQCLYRYSSNGVYCARIKMRDGTV